MVRSKLIFVTLFIVANIVVATISFNVGQRMRRVEPDQSGVYYTQAMLAFSNYTSYGRIKDFLERKCYDAALTNTREMQNLQMILLSDNLKGAKNDPELVEYVSLRNPELLKAIQAGQIPELHPYTTTCPAQPKDSGPGSN